ncbi:MAG TPA: ABC transporter permease [Holophagaceae bacterium]|jgi:lipooligosaccharide transport system permease protein|nr:ABC transporter permease [Holophagaceae bacterium]
MNPYAPAAAWQSRAVLGRHLRVHVRNWYTVTLPPVCEPLIMLLAFGGGLGRQIGTLSWQGQRLDYLHYLAPGILAYTAFMSSFFQSLFGAFIRMHFQKSWEGQLTTQVRLEHVVWGEALWAATLATAYAVLVCVVLAGFGLAGALRLHWIWLPAAVPLLFLAALAFSAIGLFFTAILPSIDHMSLPFFLVIMPIGFASSTYFPLPDIPLLLALANLNPLHHLAEGLRWLLLAGTPTWHLAAAAALCLALLAALVPMDMRLLRKRVFGDN